MTRGDDIASTLDAAALFVPASGAAVLTILSSRGTELLAAPSHGALTLGRHADNDLCLDDPEVSRWHAVLHFDGPEAWIEDLGGANGTKVAGQAVPARQRRAVGWGVPVQLGGVVLLLRPAGPPRRRLNSVAVHSPKMQALYAQAAQVARGRLSILLLGETGVGKEVFARAVHAASPRANGPWVVLNCGALAESLLESELFGHTKGAFTGADRDKPGLLEAAHGGTMFLDEVGELPAAMQVKLLRVLENGEVLRLGAVRPQPIDVRFVAATNRDLEASTRQGLFRADLYFRLAGATFTLLPLRARPEALEPFAWHFAREAAQDAGLPEPSFEPGAMDRLRAHPWPGNLRELKNVMTRAVLLNPHARVEVRHLPDPRDRPPDLSSGPTASPMAAPAADPGLSPAQQQERLRIIEALHDSGGNQTRAAQALGVSRQTLVKKLDRYDLPRPRK